MFIINENDDMVEVDEGGAPICPDSGANEHTYYQETMFVVEDEDGAFERDVSGCFDKSDLPTCPTCGVLHPLSNCSVCGVRERMPSKFEDMQSAPLCRDCFSKWRRLLGAGHSNDPIFVGYEPKERLLEALEAWRNELKIRKEATRAKERTYDANNRIRDPHYDDALEEEG